MKLLQLETPILELMLRATFLFVLFMILFRILPRRTAGEMAPMDFVFLLLITEAASHSLGEFSSLADGTVQILTFMGLNYLTNRLSYHFPFMQKLLEHSPLPVVEDGRMLRRNMSRETLTEDELMGGLRREGIDDVAKARKVCLEGDGQLSVIRKDD
ncbi:MAG TPA: DUF421 domain-containing protein [Paracoccus sp. (in: a-proteobacteria)]|nr:DUF421 domain-containing protein [Paracoccus sp. (in: a-proteobacteria)]